MTATWNPLGSIGYATTAISIGVGVYYLQQQVISSNPIAAACTSIQYASMEEFRQKTGYESYDTGLGLVLFNPWVCISTQKLYEIVSTSAAVGPILLVCRAMLQFLATVVTITEAGRQGNRGILLYPTLIRSLCFCFGSSIAFPAVWVSSCCLLGGPINQDGGVVNLLRARIGLGVWIALPQIIFTIMVLTVDTQRGIWKLCAGLLGSPILPLLPLVCWGRLLPPQLISSKDAIQSAKAVAFSFGVAGGIAFLGWIYVSYLFVTNYGADLGRFWNDVWSSAGPTTQALFVDAVAMCAALLVHIASRYSLSAVEALLLMPFIGPGAACALELATVELERFSVPANADIVTPESRSKSSKIKKH